MNRTISARFMALTVLFALIAWQPVMAAEMDHAAHVGERIHTSTVDGYKLAYHLLVLPNKAQLHLVTYITDSENQPVSEAKVGYLVVGPDGKKQKVMAMAMTGSFGGDVDFTAKGTYTVTMKAVFGAEKLIDSFNHTIQ